MIKISKISKKTYTQLKKLVDNYEKNNPPTDEQPYLKTIEVVHSHKYNPKYGDGRICICNHSYDRHFDSYDNMTPVGCKYCECFEFVEKTDDESFNGFLKDIFHNIIPNRNKELRIGQSLMIYLHEIWRAEYARITGTEVDCFYNDDLITKTINHLKTVWKNYPNKE